MPRTTSWKPKDDSSQQFCNGKGKAWGPLWQGFEDWGRVGERGERTRSRNWCWFDVRRPEPEMSEMSVIAIVRNTESMSTYNMNNKSAREPVCTWGRPFTSSTNPPSTDHYFICMRPQAPHPEGSSLLQIRRRLRNSPEYAVSDPDVSQFLAIMWMRYKCKVFIRY